MSFISYAQNGEDVMLWRALHRYGPGFYIDVGACDPVADSVTKAFYDAGWRGINIEPILPSFERIQAARPRDINLNVAAAAEEGTAVIFAVDGGNGLSTLSPALAEQYGAEGKQIESRQVTTTTLAAVCREFVRQEIHFLKIDVEGSEEAVLRGADLVEYRPWIILLEARDPAAWENLLIERDYNFVYSDGLNRFYLADEKRQLLEPPFHAPPQLFGEFERAEWHALRQEREDLLSMLAENGDVLEEPGRLPTVIRSLQTRNGELKLKVDRLSAELEICRQELYEDSRYIGQLSVERHNAYLEQSALQARVVALQTQIAELQAHIAELQTAISEIRKTVSWRVTAPLRLVSSWLRSSGLRR